MRSVLGICNPFYDRSALVSDAFLKEVGLTKGQTMSVFDKAPVEETWQKKPTATPSRWTVGGSGTNVLRSLGEFGLSCRIHGKIGNDEKGREIEKRLVDKNITPMFSRANTETGTVNCFISGDSQRTMHTYLGSALELSEKDIQQEAFVGASHVHLEGYLIYYGQTLATSISYAKQVGATTSLDLASSNVVQDFKLQFQQHVPKIDYVLGNVDEMEVYTGNKDFKLASRSFRPQQTVIATEGKDGCWVKNKNEEPIHYDALEVADVIDTTGAGDFFAAGFLAGALQDDNIQQCVQKANLAASFVIREMGADLPPKKWNELKNLMGKI